jgi:hypothetical protein
MANVIDAGTIMVSIGGVVTHCLTSTTLSGSADTIDTTCHNTAGAKSSRPGAKQWTVAFGGWYTDGDHATEKEVDDFITLMAAGTEVTLRWGSQVSGKKYYEMLASLTEISAEASGTGNNASYSGTFTVNGVLTPGTNP